MTKAYKLRTIFKNVANFELCRELYRLSGWNDTFFGWMGLSDKRYRYTDKLPEDYAILNYPLITPAYDLSYLLKKLPKGDSHHIAILVLDSSYSAVYQSGRQHKQRFWADTPEDAACTLAIELLKQNILKRS